MDDKSKFSDPVDTFPLKKSEFVPQQKIKIKDGHFKSYQDLIRSTVIPYQWGALNDEVEGAEPSHAIKNIRIAAGLEQGEFKGFVFQDSDLYKWLEAVGYSLSTFVDPELQKTADDLIDLLALAQQDDGYLNSYFTVKEPDKKWTNLRDCHELYCAGHLIEAAVAYFNATGNNKIIDIVTRLTNHIDKVFGPESGKLKGYPGHEEIELALIKLFKVTGNDRFLKLSKFFIDERGQKPLYFETEAQARGGANHFDIWNHLGASYFQSHIPVREQEKAIGHAVRAVYLYSGMADVASETNDESLFLACKTLWNNIVQKQMYITGAIGSMAFGEAFSFDYDLPNDLAYAETCASIGLVFFAHRMLQIENDRKYSDVLELSLYNSVLSGISLDGKKFFYVNPLEVFPEACEKNKTKQHVKPTRQPWFGCACCPPNISRLLMSLGSYIYSSDRENINVHLFMSSDAEVLLKDNVVKISQETEYPWDGKIRFEVSPASEGEFGINIRIPSWCQNWSATCNSVKIPSTNQNTNGYLEIRRVWKKGDLIELNLEMPITKVKAHPKLRANTGKAAVMRGPLVYCLEESDNGKDLHNIQLQKDSTFYGFFEKESLNGTYVIYANAKRITDSDWNDFLYSSNVESTILPVNIKFIPYFQWANRDLGEMIVWVNQN